MNKTFGRSVRRFCASKEQMKRHGFVQIQQTSFGFLLFSVGAGAALSVGQIVTQNNHIAEHETTIRTHLGTISEMEEQRANRIAQHEAVKSSLEQQILDLGGTISTLKVVVAEKEGVISEKESIIGLKDKTISEKNQEVRKKETLIAQRESLIRKKESQIYSMNDQIQEKSREYQHLKHRHNKLANENVKTNKDLASCVTTKSKKVKSLEDMLKQAEQEIRMKDLQESAKNVAKP